MNETRSAPDTSVFTKARYCKMCDVWFKLLRTVWCPDTIDMGHTDTPPLREYRRWLRGLPNFDHAFDADFSDGRLNLGAAILRHGVRHVVGVGAEA